MNTIKENVSSKSGILLDTKYAIEEFNLIWRVSNFSQIFDTVHAEFSLQNNSTLWKLRLVNKRFIYLCRCDKGEPVNVEIKYRLVTRDKTFENTNFYKFLSGNDINILRIQDPGLFPEATKVINSRDNLIEFENDIFEFYCEMKIVGPAVTKVVSTNDFSISNLEKLSGDFKKLLNNREHCDVMILTGTKKLPVHKAILCARSQVFERMFQSDMLESKNQIIELDDLDCDIVEDFVTFLYTGEVKMFSVEKTMNLYYVADKYQVEDLRQKCSLYLEFNLSVYESCTVLKFAEMHGDEKLKNAVIFYMRMHADEVKLTDDWKDLFKTHPKLALDVFK